MRENVINFCGSVGFAPIKISYIQNLTINY